MLMLPEFIDTSHDFVGLASRNATRAFADPWPYDDLGKLPTYCVFCAKQRSRYNNGHSRALHSGSVPERRMSTSHLPVYIPLPEATIPHSSLEVGTRPDYRMRRHSTLGEQRIPSQSATNPLYPRPVSAPYSVDKSTDVRLKRNFADPVRAASHYTQRLRLDELRPDLAQCDILIIALADIEICKEIFSGWCAQLNQAEPRRIDKLELSIMSTVRKLDGDASAALLSSHSLFRDYRTLLYTIERNVDHISQSRMGGSPFTSEISSLASRIFAHSRTLSDSVRQMQGRLRLLVRDIERTKGSVDKRELKREIWHWIARVFKAVAALISAGGAIFAMVHPLGLLVESVAIGGGSMLIGTVARLSRHVEQRYNEKTFDEMLTLLRRHIPESAKAAEIALTSFRTCQRILRAEVEVRTGKRSGWVSARDAERARGQWAQAEQRLLMAYANRRH